MNPRRYITRALLVTLLCMSFVACTAFNYGGALRQRVPDVVQPHSAPQLPQPVRPQNYPSELLLDAHDGKITQAADGTYYLYGTSYGCGWELANPTTPWCGIRAYSSTDFLNWFDEGIQFSPGPTWQTRCSQGAFGCFRPHVLQRPDGTWVMWVNIAQTATPYGYAVLTSPGPLGPWTETAPARLAVNMRETFAWGDQDLTIAPDGVTAYVTYVAMDPYSPTNVHNIIVEKLDPTWTTGTGQHVSLNLVNAEAVSLFERAGLWYVIYSPMCAYCNGTKTMYQTAPSPLGPWTYRGMISGNSCNGQPAAMNTVTIKGVKVWLYQIDIWTTKDYVANPNQAAARTHIEPQLFNPDGTLVWNYCRTDWVTS